MRLNLESIYNRKFSLKRVNIFSCHSLVFKAMIWGYIMSYIGTQHTVR